MQTNRHKRKAEWASMLVGAVDHAATARAITSSAITVDMRRDGAGRAHHITSAYRMAAMVVAHTVTARGGVAAIIATEWVFHKAREARQARLDFFFFKSPFRMCSKSA